MQNRAFNIIDASEVKGSLIQPTIDTSQMFQFDRSVLMLKIIIKICLESLHDTFTERSMIS